MKRREDGGFTATVVLAAGQLPDPLSLLDNGRWENNSEVDGWGPNEFRGADSVVEV